MGVPACPFQVGDRVRVKPDAAFAKMRFRRGVVTKIRHFPSGCLVHILRDGARPHDRYHFSWRPDSPSRGRWEHAPACDISLDDAAVAMARAVLAGDTSAARALADRVCELVNKEA